MSERDEDDSLARSVELMRNQKRPEMADVVEVLDRLFEKFSTSAVFLRMARGPAQWSWMDATHADRGYEKWYILTGSTMAGAEGYPLLTIRQSTAPRLDAWLSVSQLIMGPDLKEIESSFALAIANHHGAFEGLRSMVSDVSEMVDAAEKSEAETKKVMN